MIPLDNDTITTVCPFEDARGGAKFAEAVIMEPKRAKTMVRGPIWTKNV
jgi:hypothetical protein